MVTGSLIYNSIGGQPGNTDILVYDGVHPFRLLYKRQMATIVSSEENTITLKTTNVQLHAGGCDCGLFAIAFATVLANPSECCFKQDAVRDHLHNSLESGWLMMFPLQHRELSRLCLFLWLPLPQKELRHVGIIKLYCTCQIPAVPPNGGMQQVQTVVQH